VSLRRGLGEVDLDDEAIQAVTELVKAAVELKKSGILGWMQALAEAGEKLQELAMSDRELFRLIALGYALQAGVARLEPGDFAQARRNLEETTACLFNGIAHAKLAEAPKPGLLGLLKALGDERVRKGLGVLLELARGLGECALKAEGRGK